MAERKWKPLGSMDWLDNKRTKALRVSNDREAFQVGRVTSAFVGCLKRIRRSLDSMKIMNENLLKQEERKVKWWLRKQVQVSPSGSYKSLYYKPLSYPESSQDETTDTQLLSGKDSIDMPWSQYGDHLPNFVSFLRLPTKKLSYGRKCHYSQTLCLYLRLSQSNIDTLLELCKESGIYIDLHPHMKESDIDVSTVLSSNTSRAL
ncbi:hypothetical protein JD844_000404 [Phrynosoma platyrhinos]|uniref:Uncharacterized protein n=1 Tax=Phrynosoma platyrhinos TaxID=52577 RepID=A0ABQ7SQJ4_PHRPL|nr:hypothetical protein JD844_000404 [Phrynosoma platyrhinos]